MKKSAKIFMLMAAVSLLFTSKINAQISVGVSIQANIAPPVMPTYVQPACPVDGYLWQPGYWAWDPESADYYWVPGVWIAPPQPGLLWTPAYWGYAGGVYVYHGGYWGQHVGFYGGINYGGGFFGVGFVGGAWSGGHFSYNTAVVNVNRTVVHNTYVNNTVINNTTIVNNHVSFNGGNGGVNAQPRPQELQAEHDQHIQATNAQLSHQQAAAKDPNQFSKNNNGKPAISTMTKPNPQRFTQDKANHPVNDNHNRADATPNKPANKGNVRAHNDATHNNPRPQQQPRQQHAQQPRQQPRQQQARPNAGHSEGKKHE